MAAPTPIRVPTVLLGTRNALIDAIHSSGGSCIHASNGSYKACEVMADSLLDKGAVKSESDFLSSLKDNEKVGKIVRQELADAWELGWSSGVAGREIEENPYGS